MKRVFIIHRWSGGSAQDWRPWLKMELEKMGHEVFVPEMPDRDTPVIEKWVNYLAHTVGAPDSDTYFVGHSIGCQTILRYLETIDQPVGGAVFVAGWFNLKNLEDEEVIATARPWLDTPMNAKQIKKVLPKSTLFISDNDPYDAFEENKERYVELGAKIIVTPNAGHFTEEDGFTELPEVLSELQDFLK